MIYRMPRTNGDLTLSGAELEVKSLRILGVPLDFKLTLETYLREVVSKAVRSLGVVRRARKLLDYTRVVKSCFKAYVLSSLDQYWSPRVDVVCEVSFELAG